MTDLTRKAKSVKINVECWYKGLFERVEKNFETS